MPEISADKIIGRNLYAKKSIPKLNTSLVVIGKFLPNDFIGNVYSYIQKNGIVYWMFKDYSGKYFLTKHDASAYKFSSDIEQAFKQQEIEKEKEVIEQKGQVPYYIEKYGKVILVGVLGAYLLSTYIKTMK